MALPRPRAQPGARDAALLRLSPQEPPHRLTPLSATLSSTYNPHCNADNCIDGDGDDNSDNCDSPHSSLCHSTLEDSPWLSIDLGVPRDLAAVAVWNRINCCQARLGSFEVWVGSSLEHRFAERCVSANATATPGPFVETCTATGRVVTLLLPGSDRQLNLQEVAVYATTAVAPAPPSAPPVAMQRAASPNAGTATFPVGQFAVAVALSTLLVLIALAVFRFAARRIWWRALGGPPAEQGVPLQTFVVATEVSEVMQAGPVEEVPKM